MTPGEVKQGAQQWRAAAWVTRTEGGARARAFEALEPIRCQNCQHMIQPGEFFSRIRRSTHIYFRVPFCRACVPLRQPLE